MKYKLDDLVIVENQACMFDSHRSKCPHKIVGDKHPTYVTQCNNEKCSFVGKHLEHVLSPYNKKMELDMSPLVKTESYKAISRFYYKRLTKRTNTPYINHINHGLKIMNLLTDNQVPKDAYCIHPIVQATDDLVNELNDNLFLSEIDPLVIMMVMEYRSTANMFLSYKEELTESEERVIKTRLDKIPDLRVMLIADKVQNRFSFEKNYKNNLMDTEKSEKLAKYFSAWLEILRINEAEYFRLIKQFIE